MDRPIFYGNTDEQLTPYNVIKKRVIAGRQLVRHKPLTIEIRKTEYRES
ncbi:hypothetical protein [Brevibacillus porteri]